MVQQRAAQLTMGDEPHMWLAYDEAAAQRWDILQTSADGDVQRAKRMHWYSRREVGLHSNHSHIVRTCVMPCSSRRSALGSDHTGL